MWMLSAGTRPYWDRPHDFDISSELRLVVHGTLLVFAKLTFWMLVVTLYYVISINITSTPCNKTPP